MTGFEIRRGSLFAAACLLLFATPSIQAAFTVGAAMYDETILADNFNAATLNAQWASHVSNSGSVTPYATGDTTTPPNQPGSLVLWTQRSGSTASTRNIRSTAYINYETDGGLNYGASPNHWGAEIKLKMINNQFVVDQFEWASNQSGHNWSILTGFATTDNNAGWPTDPIKGFDLRATRNGLGWNLNWYGADFTVAGASRTSTLINLGGETFPQENWLHNQETYTIGLHRKQNGMVDIYFTGNVYKQSTDALVQTYNNQLVATFALIDGVNPGGLIAGDYTQSAIGGKMALDSVKIGAFIPEPTSVCVWGLMIGLVSWYRAKRISK